ncbi:hypothetical protein NDU88_000291 [Pleurodeles waltl]|uniref:Uncharacterized protein n=1 Tax=Pleurodeles waltl TaxID=8319 RepID=A0AAV7KKW7_PLEWA|nr:hypothetical protein NDU88_000291 [Pleurodeles waltl]
MATLGRLAQSLPDGCDPGSDFGPRVQEELGPKPPFAAGQGSSHQTRPPPSPAYLPDVTHDSGAHIRDGAVRVSPAGLRVQLTGQAQAFGSHFQDNSSGSAGRRLLGDGVAMEAKGCQDSGWRTLYRHSGPSSEGRTSVLEAH